VEHQVELFLSLFKKKKTLSDGTFIQKVQKQPPHITREAESPHKPVLDDEACLLRLLAGTNQTDRQILKSIIIITVGWNTLHNFFYKFLS